ncbi:MAG: hypothetical protein E7162_04545 [Firmicutes bacterium]|nr:hypothetical protein [Bacillota bacterium]
MSTNTNCEPEIKIYNFLQDIRKEKPEFYEPVKRILRYMYKIVKKDYFDEEANDFFKIGEKDKGKNIVAAQKNMFKYYVHDEDGILDNLIKITKDNPEYFTYFYHKIEPFLEMAENGIYSEYGIYKYVFNIYTILRFYSMYKEDFDGFKMITDDLSTLFITSLLNIDRSISYIWGADKPNFYTKMDVIEALLSLPNYKTNEKIREEIKKVLDEINYIYEDNLLKEYKRMSETLISLYQAVDELKEKGYIVKPEVIDKLEDEIMYNVKNGKINGDYSEKRRYAGTNIVLFIPLFLIQERYEIFKEMLNKKEDNQYIQNDILSYIKKMDPSFFDFLNQKMDVEDSFISCMNIVLDSDTYHEVASKLDDVVKASKLYKEDEQASLELISALKSTRHKEVIDGVVMHWPENNNINKTNKPEKIIDRMRLLQKTLEFAPSDEFYTERKGSYYYPLTLKNFSDRVIGHMKEARNKKEREIAEQKRQEEEAKKQQEEIKKPKGLGSLFAKKNNN